MSGRKPEITEEEFAGYFCRTVGMEIQNNWASILEDINKLMGGDDNNVYAHGLDMLHFVLPFMAIKSRELPCLLEKGQADRIREFVLESISEGGYHPNARERMEEYQKVGDDSLKMCVYVPPHNSVAHAFLQTLDYKDTQGSDPIVTEGMGQLLVELYPGLLKELIGNYGKIVPEGTRMTAFRYRGMDNSGQEVSGYLDAGSDEEAQSKLRAQEIFVTNLSAFAPEVTPEWSAISLASPSSIPSGRLLVLGVPCTHEQRGMSNEGSLNLLGVGGELHLILDRPGRGTLELPVQNIKAIKHRGLFRKSLLVTTSTFEEEEHVFRGPVSRLQSLCEWAIFATEKVTEGEG